MLKSCLMAGTCALAWLAVSAPVAAQESATGATRARLPPAPGASHSDAGQRAAPTNQDVNAGSATAVGEVVVTAAHRADTLQHAAIAATAFTDERRNLLGIENARDITNLTPSLSLTGEYLTLRGIGRYEDPGQGADPGVSVNVDGVYTSSPAYLNQPDFLTDRIVVVPGPNSVFGRNAIGGSVDVFSKRPTADFHGDLRAGYASTNFSYVDAAASGPINDVLRYHVGYSYSHLANGPDSPQNNINPGSKKDPGAGDTRLYEAQLEWTPTRDLDVWFRYQGFSGGTNATYGVSSGVGLASPYLTGTAATYTTLLFDGLAPNPQFGLPGASNPQLNNRNIVNVDDVGFVRTKNDHTATLHVTNDFHWATLKYIGSYNQYDFVSSSDADFTNRKFLTSPGGNPVASEYLNRANQRKQWYTNELILTSPDTQRLRWTLGAFDYYERYRTLFHTDDPLATYMTTPTYLGNGLPAPANPDASIYSQRTALTSGNEAVYGQLDYDLTSTLKLTGFVRENFDQRYGQNSFRYIFDTQGIYGDFGATGALDVTPGTPGVPGAHEAHAKNYYTTTTGKAGVEWRPDNSLTAYVSYARGYKSGGFDLANFTPVLSVKPEELNDFEGGIKKTFGKKLLINGAFYYYDYSNLQVPISVATFVTGPNLTPGAPAGSTTTTENFASVLANAQSTRSIGLELQSVWSPMENLHITAVYSYLSSEFQDFHSPTPGGLIHDLATGQDFTNLARKTVPQSPRNKFSIIPQYVITNDRFSLSLSSTLSFVDQQFYGVYDGSRYSGPAYYNIDLRAVLQPKNSHLTAIFYARNLTDTNQYVFNGVGQPAPAYPVQVNNVYSENVYTINEPQSFGVELQYRF